MPDLPKPEYTGSFDGQVRTLSVKVPTGKRFPWHAPSGKTVWLPVVESRVVVQWTWDHDRREWVDDDTWRRRRCGPNVGKFSVSKRTPLERMLAERQRRQNNKLRQLRKKGA